jgi:hypothetical protein
MHTFLCQYLSIPNIQHILIDISSEDERKMSPYTVYELRDNYTKNLRSLIFIFIYFFI